MNAEETFVRRVRQGIAVGVFLFTGVMFLVSSVFLTMFGLAASGGEGFVYFCLLPTVIPAVLLLVSGLLMARAAGPIKELYTPPTGDPSGDTEDPRPPDASS